MARLTCRNCSMQYNLVLGACPNCGTRPLPLWRRVVDWHWPLPLAIGLALQALLYAVAPEQVPGGTVPPMPEAAMVSQFVAAALIFSLLAAVLLFAARRTCRALRRSSRRQ